MSGAESDPESRTHQSSTPLHFESITDVGDRIRSGEISSVALTRHMLGQIEAHDARLNAYIEVTADLALRQAHRADSELAQGQDRGRLHGVPVAIKDIFATNGIRTTCGSKLFADWVPDYDAEVVRKLREAGAVLLGKTGMHELAYGMNGVNPYYGPTRNPWALDRDAGGSSGGSAAAVAAGLAFAALGTDTGGSVRQPAHSCGIVGFKPSFGRVSKAGVLPLAWSMDHVGPLTRSVADAALLLGAIEGRDPADPYSVSLRDRAADAPQECALQDLRIGIVRRHFFEGHSEVVTSIDGALGRLKQAGAELIELDIADIEEATKAARTTFAEANAVHEADFAERPEDFGMDVRKKLEAARKLSAADYAKAQHFRQGFRQRVEGLFADRDLLAMPTATITSAPIDERPEDHPHLSWKSCGIFNFTGHPAISLPCDLVGQGLPVGLMLVGPLHRDETLLHHAGLVEAALAWRRRPTGFE